MMALLIITLLLVAAPSIYAEETKNQIQLSKYLQVPQIALSFEVPFEREPAPFNTYIVPSSDLRAPDEISASGENYFEVPVPSQDLEVPSAAAWNPDNDPALLYALPAAITKEVRPTNQHPKKYEKSVFEKRKPTSSRPKEEIVLEPVKVQDYVNKYKQQEKTNYKFAKYENQKLINADKVKHNSSTPLRPPIDSSSSANHFHPALERSGDRIEFQMHGFDGRKSYKWGYDTGKGKNRQFRYEESNKDGYIKGHYGYYDKNGELQMTHYESHPEGGFHADST